MADKSPPLHPYTIVTRTQTAKWIPQMNAAVEGWEFLVNWGPGDYDNFTVFVPGLNPPPDDVHAAILAQGVTYDQYAALGK